MYFPEPTEEAVQKKRYRHVSSKTIVLVSLTIQAEVSSSQSKRSKPKNRSNQNR